METGVFQHLSDYLVYMHQLGFEGLPLEKSPFIKAEIKPQLEVKQPPPKKSPEKKRPNPEKVPQTNQLSAIMDSLDAMVPGQENRQKAAAVKGETKVDLLRNLFTTFEGCQACALGTTRSRFVFGEGNPEARVLFLGHGPGREEDRCGRPFVGEAGQLLDKIIEAMGLKRSDVFIANVVKCHPPENRAPLPDEIVSCSPILTRQIEAVAPSVIVALGPTALRFFSGPKASFVRRRGKFFKWNQSLVMPTYHPEHVLRNPSAKREVWQDMRQVMAQLGS